jgi:NADH:ubiquinone oxidoreductase subunit K
MFALQQSSFGLLIISKLLFGIGFQPMILAKDIIMAAWFFGAELSLANNLNLAISREVTFLTSILTPGITAAHGIT